MLPPRRPPWPSNSPSSTASRYIGQRTATITTTSSLTPTAATTTTTSTTPLTTTLVPAPSVSQGSTTSSSARVSPQPPPPLTPPQYPAPPRPPSRNGKFAIISFHFFPRMYNFLLIGQTIPTFNSFGGEFHDSFSYLTSVINLSKIQNRIFFFISKTVSISGTSSDSGIFVSGIKSASCV